MERIMRKHYLGILPLLLILALFLTACTAKNAADFVPFDANLLLTYELEGEFELTWQIFNAYTTDNRLQRRLMMNDQVVIEVLEVVNGNIIAVNSYDNFTSRASVLGQPPNIHSIVIAEPIELGHTWLLNPQLGAESPIMEITGVDISVTTPAGTFETIEITTFQPLEDGFITPPRIREYFAPGIGSVMQISYMGVSTNMPGWDEEDFEEESMIARLTDIQRDAQLTETVHLFYMIDDDFPQMQMDYTTNNDLAVLYNDVINHLFDLAFDGSGGGVTINHAVMNMDAQLLNLDFNAAFLTEMARAADYEQERRLLNAVATTFGVLYNMADVRITVDGAPYNGTFITLGHAESIRIGQDL